MHIIEALNSACIYKVVEDKKWAIFILDNQNFSCCTVSAFKKKDYRKDELLGWLWAARMENGPH